MQKHVQPHNSQFSRCISRAGLLRDSGPGHMAAHVAGLVGAALALLGAHAVFGTSLALHLPSSFFSLCCPRLPTP